MAEVRKAVFPAELSGRVQGFEAFCPIAINDLRVEAFPLTHDAPETVGVVVETNRRSLTYLTDLGSFDDELVPYLEKKDLLFLEANHEPALVEVSPYPEHVKRRILSPYGHLSNSQALFILSRLKSSPQNLILGHLSRTNNSPDILLERLKSHKMLARFNTVQVASQDELTKVVL